MAKTNVQVQSISEATANALGSLVVLPKVDAPFTTVVKRAQVTDFSKDLMPRMGIDRVQFQVIQEIQGEYGSSQESVYKPINDIHDQVRFVGNWTAINGGSGSYIGANATTDYTEITFYGTGLNGLYYYDSGTRTVGVSIDGGSVTNIPVTGNNTIGNSRGFANNTVINLASGLTLGLHTAKLTHAAANLHLMFGFEVLTISGTSPNTLQLIPGTAYQGGKKLYKSASSVDSYNTNFASGTLGTRGGRVTVYQKTDGTIAKAVTPAEASQTNIPSTASHTNDEFIRRYHVHEFAAGANRADDFSKFSLSGAASRAFTLEDGVTTLVMTLGDGAIKEGGIFQDGATGGAAGNHTTITFMGTGLDVLIGTTTTFGNVNVTCDGVAIGSIPQFTSSQKKLQPVVSGLPYGVHTVRFASSAGGAGSWVMRAFDVYGPKKATIPTGAVELGEYYILADYAITSSSAVTFASTGVLRKFGIRENIYVGTWAAIGSVDTSNFNGAWNINAVTAAAYAECTFYGTGVEWHGFLNNTNVSNMTITIDGLALNTGTNTGSTVTETINATTVGTGTAQNGITISAAGVITGTSTFTGAAFWRISGLALGKHVIRVTQNSTGAQAMFIDSFDVITPIHYPNKSTIYATSQNSLPIGNQCIGDSRRFSEQSVKQLTDWTQAVGITSNPTTNVPAAVPVPDLVGMVKTNGNPIEVTFHCEFAGATVDTQIGFYIYVDGLAQPVNNSGALAAPQTLIATKIQDFTFSAIIPVNAGVHIVQIMWQSFSATVFTATTTRRIMKVRELL